MKMERPTISPEHIEDLAAKSHIESGSDAKIILRVAVELTPGDHSVISVRHGDKAVDLAQAFVSTHDLDAAYVVPLQKHILDKLEVLAMANPRVRDVNLPSTPQRSRKRSKTLFQSTHDQILNESLNSTTFFIS